MLIAGVQKLSLVDYPGKPSTVIFTQGCNWNCPWCHNRKLIPMKSAEVVSTDDVLMFIQNRLTLIKNVVISGGEPTVQKDLLIFIRVLKNAGLNIKLDTNGSNPEMLKDILDEGLLSYVAMDIKSTYFKYGRVTGTDVDRMAIRRSINVITNAKNIDYHFRTTLIPELTAEDIDLIKTMMIPEGAKHITQEYRKPV